jgi:hypothetical protein
MHDEASDAHFESELDAHIADIHEWLDSQYRGKYRAGQTETCLEAVLVCQEERVPLPPWLIEALKNELELAVRRPVDWEQLKVAAQKANQERKRIALQRREWYLREAKDILKDNPTLNSEDRLARLISKRAEGAGHAAAPRTIRRHIRGILAKPSTRGQD